ncbi:hypothetical protein NIES39_L06640 [Arthrospira platensis NIES-39]|nr:hypothetical protein NIES39_L06640 [Arthrospira platensis NIES-39]
MWGLPPYLLLNGSKQTSIANGVGKYKNYLFGKGFGHSSKFFLIKVLTKLWGLARVTSV